MKKNNFFSEVKLKVDLLKRSGVIVHGSFESANLAYSIYNDESNDFGINHRESFIVMFFDNSSQFQGWQLISHGGISGALVDIRLIFQGALLSNSSRIIVCHNHPSGNLRPSEKDISTTKKIKEACKILEIDFLDHLIIGGENNSYFSFNDSGI